MLSIIRNKIEEMLINSSFKLDTQVISAIKQVYEADISGQSKSALDIIIENTKVAAAKKLPLCQDTGLFIFFVEMGNKFNASPYDIEKIIHSVVKSATSKVYLRASVCEPFSRENTKNNLPCFVHFSFSQNDYMRVKLIIKGGGSENKTTLTMLNPSESEAGIVSFVYNSVKSAGAMACPPYFLGIGVGGTADHALLMSKMALLDNLQPETDLEHTIIAKVNTIGTGPLGMGGSVTAAGINLLSFPCHIATMPVALSIGCHSLRRGGMIIYNDGHSEDTYR